MNNNLPRYRTIKECLVELKKLDNDTAITEHFIRQLCKKNQIEYLASGNKSLVNFDSLLKYLGYNSTPVDVLRPRTSKYFQT